MLELVKLIMSKPRSGAEGKCATFDVTAGKSVVKYRSGVARGSYALIFFPARAGQATGDFKLDTEWVKFMEKPSEPVAVAFEDAVPSVPSEVQAGGSRSSASRLPSSGVEDADLVALREHIQELQPENEDLLSRRAWYKML